VFSGGSRPGPKPGEAKEEPVETDKIRRFIEEEIVLEEGMSLTDDTPLLDGVIDSIGLMRMVAFIEDEYDVEVDDAEITADNFRTVGDISRLVERRVAAER
jgi:acyl carrier protein